MKRHPLAAKGLSTRRAEGIPWAATLLALSVQASGAEATLVANAKQFFKPLPQDMATAEFPTLAPRVELGKKLFFDPRLSADGTVACATCHRPALYGTDALPKSIGVEHRVNARNAPTVVNAALQFKAHWIGDRANVEEQAMKSLLGQASFGNPDNAAEGRYKETQDPADKYVFKVPSLRNVSMTPPYFHDGSVATLPQAVRTMAKVQLGKTLTEGQINDLVAFLQSLTGPLPKEFSTEPVLAPQAFGATRP